MHAVLHGNFQHGVYDTGVLADNPRILVVDGKVEIREMLELNLRLRGFSVKTAEDGVHGLANVRDWNPDLIILGMTMKADGFMVVRALGRLTEAPIIMLWGKTDVQGPVRGLKGGTLDYLPKPFEMIELVSRIRTQLGNTA